MVKAKAKSSRKRRRKSRKRAGENGFTSADTKLLAGNPKVWLRQKAKQCVEASRWFRKKANRLEALADKIRI